MGKLFKFELGQRLKINVHEEVAEVHARAEWQDYGDSYLMRYKSKDGKVVTDWIHENQLSCVTQ